MEDLLRIGVVTTTHGIKGEVKVFPTTDDIKRFKKCDEVILITKEGNITLHVESVKYFKNIVILKFKEFNNINDVERFRKCDLMVTRDNALPLKEGQYYLCDVPGAVVINEDTEEEIGKVTDVMETGANNVFVIETKEGKEVLFPVIPDCIKKVDTKEGIVRAHVMTLFPEMIEQAMNTSIMGRAMADGLISLQVMNIRDYTLNKHGKVDDYPYGGGAGMVMEAEPIYRCYEQICSEAGKRPRVIYLTPQGDVFSQKIAKDFSKEDVLVFLCGHYEGVDERVLEEIVTDCVSIGDYVLTGGELPALVMMDAIARLVPGVLNNEESAETESFSDGLLEYPQYTRPVEILGRRVPDVLMSGHHEKINEWRKEQSIMRTRERRPDLYKSWLENNSDT